MTESNKAEIIAQVMVYNNGRDFERIELILAFTSIIREDRAVVVTDLIDAEKRVSVFEAADARMAEKTAKHSALLLGLDWYDLRHAGTWRVQ
jgi:hypothetical protein